jgi:molecular chaperone DnaK
VSKIIGIDLGTTNSVVAVMEGTEVKVITNPSGTRTTPSVVAFKGEERIIGQSAKNQAVTDPEKTIYSIKRFMGRVRSEVKGEEKLVPYKIVGESKDAVKVEVDGKAYAPPEISAMVLSYMKKYAEDYIGEPVTQAVITVPAYFNDAQRQATKVAGEIAGLEVKRIINEPTAAALAYSLDKKQGEKILVFDLGGGTFDVSVLEVGDGVVEVKATSGDTHLGGDDYDQAVIDFVAERFQKEKGVDLRKDRLALGRLKEGCEKAKCELSNVLTTTLNMPFITQINGQPAHLQMEITRAQFEEITKPLTERCRKPVEQALSDAKLEPKEIDEVVLVGGSTRIPAVQAMVKEMFGGKEPNKSVNPDEVVAVGAAIQGAVLAGDKTDILLLDVTSLSLGIETLGGAMEVMIPRNTTIPTQKKNVFSTAFDNQRAVDIQVFQGERKLTKGNRHLGTVHLDGIPPAPAKAPRIEVLFDIDSNGILSVTAKDLGTGLKQSAKIETSTGLSKGEIERMKKEAEDYAADDEKRLALVEARNNADSVLFRTERTLRSAIGLDEATKKLLATKIAELKAARDGDEPEAIEKAIEAIYATNAGIYGAAGGAPPANGAPVGANGSAAKPAPEKSSDEEESEDEEAEEPADFGGVRE